MYITKQDVGNVDILISGRLSEVAYYLGYICLFLYAEKGKSGKWFATLPLVGCSARQGSVFSLYVPVVVRNRIELVASGKKMSGCRIVSIIAAPGCNCQPCIFSLVWLTSSYPRHVIDSVTTLYLCYFLHTIQHRLREMH